MQFSDAPQGGAHAYRQAASVHDHRGPLTSFPSSLSLNVAADESVKLKGAMIPDARRPTGRARSREAVKQIG